VDPQGIGSAIRLARHRIQLSAARLAELSGVTEQTILRIERGSNQPRIPTLQKIAKGLGLNPSVLLGTDEENRGD
jgi:transcriptional regulator with XRE-family HTH domain